MIIELNGNKLSYSEIKEVILDLRNMGYKSRILKEEYLYSYEQAYDIVLERYIEQYYEIKKYISDTYYICPLIEVEEYIAGLNICIIDEGFEYVGDYYIIY